MKLGSSYSRLVKEYFSVQLIDHRGIARYLSILCRKRFFINQAFFATHHFIIAVGKPTETPYQSGNHKNKGYKRGIEAYNIVQVIILAAPFGGFFPAKPYSLFPGGPVFRKPKYDPGYHHHEKDEGKYGYNRLTNGWRQPEIKVPVQYKTEEACIAIYYFQHLTGIGIQVYGIIIGRLIMVKGGFYSTVFGKILQGVQILAR
ncbi:hypothetical protein D3C80_1310800 [compost metagenome]